VMAENQQPRPHPLPDGLNAGGERTVIKLPINRQRAGGDWFGAGWMGSAHGVHYRPQ